MFRIGEFSKIAQVSGRLLRYYDEIGLLSPEATDPESGYRFYSAQQLPRLNHILVLKELGLSLEQIARLVDQNTSIDEMRGMLALRKAQIEQTVQEEMTRLRVVESRLQQIDTYGQIQEPDVVLKAVPAQQFLALREVLSGLGVRRRLVRKIATVVPAKVGHGSLGNIAIVTHSPIFDPEALDLEVGYLLTGKAPQSVRLSEERVLTQHTLPAIETLATLAHAGRISEVHRSYGALGTWIEQHGWQINGLGRELLMQLPKSEEEEEVVIEIQMPVIKLDPSARSKRELSDN
ncbi:MerR family transcriptional regulator [Dictyobacter kobayashii]|uniref:MerR family transcriptional regulator n=1 Tax=Dictyobacter kobayashii TaxID=2014872 RepID=A0A402ABV5_9CHLR|nr:MerR family transcriptional regulator [Dictyobacter kobayashii]GCE16584.1 MerR family transcriptional regulator [Dictyobacter kobayashii]